MKTFVRDAGPGLIRNPLAGVPCLSSRVAIYVPTTCDIDRPAAEQVVAYQREAVAEALSRYFGGFTEVQAQGGWFSESKGKLIREAVYILAAACEPQARDRCLPFLVALAGRVARAMGQECVSLEVDGRQYYVPPTA